LFSFSYDNQTTSTRSITERCQTVSQEVRMSESVETAPAIENTTAPAIPKWVDVASPNMEKSRAFYSALFGWDAYVHPQPEAGGYTSFSYGGKSVAGGGPTMSPEQPAAWSTYIYIQNADATAEAVKEAGGAVIVGPLDVLDQGRMAVCTDPEGAYFSIWQPNRHLGAEHVNGPSGFCWNELNTRNPEAAKAFYGQVFGWESSTSPVEAGSYTEFKVDGRSIAGGMDISSLLPPEVPANWLVYFAVENTDDSVAKAQELGGSVRMPAMDIPNMGRFAVLSDPVGAVFAIMQFTASS
jgi:predicted enzyme related to lactoylglutathione lyase